MQGKQGDKRAGGWLSGSEVIAFKDMKTLNPNAEYIVKNGQPTAVP